MSSPRHDKLAGVMMKCIATVMLNQLSYREGIAMFKAAAALMEQIDKTPDADEDALEKLATACIEAELRA